MKIKKQKDDFIAYVLEQLSGISDVFEKRMFGGHGLYKGEYFFGIMHQGRLFFKTDETTKPQYEEYGMKPFSPSEKVILKHYYEVPISILEDEDLIEEWAKLAIGVAIQQESNRPKSRFKQGRRETKKPGH